MAGGGDVQIGERFRPAGRTAFGTPTGDVFEVSEIRTEGCVVPHALLKNVTSPNDRRLISVDALRDHRLYLAVEFQSVETDTQLAQEWRR
jgi:hypothetical protein